MKETRSHLNVRIDLQTRRSTQCQFLCTWKYFSTELRYRERATTYAWRSKHLSFQFLLWSALNPLCIGSPQSQCHWQCLPAHKLLNLSCDNYRCCLNIDNSLHMIHWTLPNWQSQQREQLWELNWTSSFHVDCLCGPFRIRRKSERKWSVKNELAKNRLEVKKILWVGARVLASAWFSQIIYLALE